MYTGPNPGSSRRWTQTTGIIYWKRVLFTAENTVLDSFVHGTRRPAAYTAKHWNPGKQCKTVSFSGSPFEGLPHPVVLFYLWLEAPCIWCFSGKCLRKPLRIPKVKGDFPQENTKNVGVSLWIHLRKGRFRTSLSRQDRPGHHSKWP